MADKTFEKWWAEDGRMYDPDTEDVPWFDKRKELAELAFTEGAGRRKEMKQQIPEPQIVGVTDEGEVVKDLSILEEHGVAYDPTQMTVDLTKAEKRRTTALMLAIQAYDKIIIKDAEYLREAHAQANRGGPVIQPATMNAMVEAAINFDAFIAGKFEREDEDEKSDEPEQAAPKEKSEGNYIHEYRGALKE